MLSKKRLLFSQKAEKSKFFPAKKDFKSKLVGFFSFYFIIFMGGMIPPIPPQRLLLVSKSKKLWTFYDLVHVNNK